MTMIILNNGVQMPALGLGVYRSPPEETTQAVDVAIRTGYRLIDTAAAYMNEREVGQAIGRSAVDRSELFVTTKLWISDYGYDAALRAFDVSLRKLGLDYLDLYLLHQPVPTEFENTVRAYNAAEKLLADGRVRAIGVSNFSIEQLDVLAARSNIVPAVNQVEVHPFFTNHALEEAHTRRGIVTQAWSPLGGVNVYMPADPNAVSNPLQHPDVKAIADTYGFTPAQVLLRWHLDSGRSAIPKSVRPERIAENFNVSGFSLTPNEIAAIDALDTGKRGGPEPANISPKTYTLKIPD
ncbi:aldo/keto reductase [Rhizobium esperanzae]|uniref:Diketogulonate reductase-like aldo/keto reductase n=1 Tax=Rhizobium esperanzae TaxID=1967781 RepID=A0A7W6R4V7_9HYPH|nr:aldo/keto reductase [Rhizobium esperanzae]MBB4236929.1 diketogulonate reductase-like aldo/keto reductase [Rhizobium esperanzae]